VKIVINVKERQIARLTRASLRQPIFRIVILIIMTRKKTIAAGILAVAAAFIGSAFAEDAAVPAAPSMPTVTMETALAEAASSGDDRRLVDRNLGVARSQRSLDLAKQGLSLSASAGYTIADSPSPDATTPQQSLISKAESAATGGSSLSSNKGIAQAVQGSLALGMPLTKVSLVASYGLPPSAATTSFPSSSIGITASQTLWDGYLGGQYRASLEKSGLTVQGKELAALQGRSAAVSKVKQAYVAMLAAQRDLAIKKQVLDKQSKLLAQVQAVFKMQQASAIDLKTAQINARSAEIDVATADKTLRLANERLAVVMGRPAGERFAVADITDPALPAESIDEAIRIGLDKRTDLAQYELSAASSRIDAALARAQAQPGVILTGGLGLAQSWASAAISASALSIGARVTLPILDSGVADFQAKASEGQAAVYGLQAALLRKTLASDIRDFFETAQLLAEKVDLAKRSADLAESQFELVKAQNNFGTATTQDLLTASVTAATAEVAYGGARNAYLLAELSLETAMGL
jgi:outer membrane protein TolC